MEDLKSKRTFETSSRGIYVIEVNVTTSGSISWVLDTSRGVHICTNMNGLSKSRILDKGQVDIHIGNGARVATLSRGNISFVFIFRLGFRT